MIINKDLIVNQLDDFSVNLIVLKRYNGNSYNGETKLNDVLSSLPAGIVNKAETGMGATTLELLTPRNSIIVEPIKITASSKAHKHNALYVGTPTRYHTKKVTKREIINYVKDESIRYKKILVVADSLKRVIGTIGDSVFKNYFLLLDEVDSFQLDSSYRKSMEDCIDIYKKFLPQNRALLSATLLEFSDPDLQNEVITSFRFDEPTSRTIKLFFTNNSNLISASTAKILEVLQDHPDDKVMVAYNSVNGCYDIANHIVKTEVLSSEQVSILCSNNSKDKVGEYFKALDSDVLPVRLNFVTSAYFTGFDLNERFHLISITGNTNPIHALSDHRLKQIAGRCRKGLYSETIVQDKVPETTIINSYTKDDLLTEAEKQIAALNCIEGHFKDSVLLKDYYTKISSTLLAALDNENRRLIRYSDDLQTIPKISYLNIDAILESTRVRRDLYMDPMALLNKLTEQGHLVNFEPFLSDLNIERVNVHRINKQVKIKYVIDILRTVTTSEELQHVFLTYYNLDPIQKKLLNHFKNLYLYIEPQNLLDLIEERANFRDSRSMNKLVLSANFLTLPDDHIFKSRVLYFFPQNLSFSKSELLERWRRLFVDTNIKGKVISETQAVQLTKTLFKTRKNTQKHKFKILGINPYGIQLIRQRPSVRDTDDKEIEKYLFQELST